MLSGRLILALAVVLLLVGATAMTGTVQAQDAVDRALANAEATYYLDAVDRALLNAEQSAILTETDVTLLLPDAQLYGLAGGRANAVIPGARVLPHEQAYGLAGGRANAVMPGVAILTGTDATLLLPDEQLYGLAGGRANAVVAAAPVADSFDWADAGTGVAIALGAVMVVLLGGLALVSYRRHEAPWHWGHGHPST